MKKAMRCIYLLSAVIIGFGAALGAYGQVLQACSYDGKPLSLQGNQLGQAFASGGASSVVTEIMKYTGLPQNFAVVEGQVPNAAAVIVRGDDGLPKRVIAYNRQFMDHVKKATQNNDWAPISIMAHEIGHHLCGHTIMPGGSQPPTELEADKFSGFVLYKMGASLDDAQIAMETLVPDKDSATHPARHKRIAAIREGWKQACFQQSEDCSGPPAHPKQGSPSDPATTHAQGSNSVAVAAKTPTKLAPPEANQIPTKFDRFVVDEIGILDPQIKDRLGQDMYRYAQEQDVEIVTLIVNDLHGLTPDQYAQAMMRQMRVGKLEVGNGAVLVVAPKQRQAGLALGSGIFTEFKDRLALIRAPLESFVQNYDRCASCPKNWSPNIARAANMILKDTRSWEWAVRYANLNELEQAYQQEQADRKAGKSVAPLDSPTWRKLVRVEAKFLGKPDGEALKRVIPIGDPDSEQVFALQAKSGKTMLAYAPASLQKMMPSPLESGQTYTFVLRVMELRTQSYQLMSYDLAQLD